MVTLNRNQIAYLKRCDALCAPAQKKIMKLEEKKQALIKEIDLQIEGCRSQVRLSQVSKEQYLANMGFSEEEIPAIIDQYNTTKMEETMPVAVEEEGCEEAN